MAKLNQVIGALMKSLAQGRSQADLATVEIAKIYKQDEILNNFPVPRLSLDEVIVDLKLAIEDTDVDETTSPKSGKKILTASKTKKLVLEKQAEEIGDLNVLVKSSDLQTIEPEKISSIKFTFKEADQTWTQIEDEKGKTKEKLVPF